MADNKKELFHWNFDLKNSDSDFTDIEYSPEVIPPADGQDDIKPFIFVDGNYNPETNMMALDFEDMPPIYIDVPKEDLRYFMNADDIEIRNPIYGVGKNDKFELLYADIYNKQTGKS